MKYNQIFTVHGTVMMFLFAIPIFEAVSILVLPQMLGARDLPFPRLSAFGFWAIRDWRRVPLRLALLRRRARRVGGSCTRRSRAGINRGIGADIWLLGFSFIEVAAIAAAVELIVGVLRSRPPGMRLNLMPLYAWYVLVAA
jgi:heme/copper-type cytochrome/quinol oxidase subunit 1